MVIRDRTSPVVLPITPSPATHLPRSPRHAKTLVDVDDGLDVAIRLLEDAGVIAETIEMAGDEAARQPRPERFEATQAFDAGLEILARRIDAADHHLVAPQQ